MRYILSLALFCLICSSCYRADKTHVNTGTPVFRVMAGNISVKDSVATFPMYDSTTSGITLTFSLISGAPQNYPITCSIVDLPHGITCVNNSVEFRLSYNVQFQLSVNADTGYYQANIKVTTPTDTHFYPIKIHVLPAIPLPQPIDCAECLTHFIRAFEVCNMDSCRPSISLIPGMAHWINIKNISCLGDTVSVNAQVFCDGRLVIPLQTNHGYTIYGRTDHYTCGIVAGFFITDTIVHTGDTQICQFNLRNY